MIQQRTTWGTIREGDYVVGRGGAPWKVLERDEEAWRRIILQNREGERVELPMPPPSLEVTAMVPTAEETAERLVREKLGGRVVGVKLAGEAEWHTPDLYDTAAAQRHLRMMHGIYASDVLDMGELLKLHDETAATVPHDHKHGLRP